MKLFITRHGETNYNVNEWVCGISEAHLTENGKAQAEELAKQLKEDNDKNNIKTIYVSPLQRARDTAKPIEEALGLRAIVEPRIQELNFGELEGKDWNKQDFLELRNSPFLKFPNGESLVLGAHRAYSFIEEVREKHSQDDGNVLFVCHGLILALMMTFFKDITQDEFMKLRIKNCQLLEFYL